jgi:acetyl esterase
MSTQTDETESTGLDPDVARALEAMGEAPYRDLDVLPLDEALAQVRFAFDIPPPPGSEDTHVPVADARTVRVRFYYPEGERRDLPVLMHLHGGGFVTGTIEMDDARCGTLSRQAGCIVASVDYPLAPEHPFPAPIEDCFAVWRWLADSAAKFGGDGSRMAISGSSAGGHLAVGVCLLARDSDAVQPVLQLLTYPVIAPNLDSASYRQFADGPFLTHARMAWFWKQYRSAGDPSGQLWAPLTGPLAGLPPAHVITAELDVLRDEAEAYAERLRAEGVPAHIHRYPGMIHGFLATVPTHAHSAAALAESAAVLREAFARAGEA